MEIIKNKSFALAINNQFNKLKEICGFWLMIIRFYSQ